MTKAEKKALILYIKRQHDLKMRWSLSIKEMKKLLDKKLAELSKELEWVL